ncbi:MAG: glycosyltransferase family 8 protein [Nannocystis sp.]|nr:glycosyltransferase family 8 protein [Nannocystis sp.]MBA3546851.1 glycosyltransferase family 8 protein [Nannocystis sp.]
MKRAYVTMVCCGDTYLPGAQALARSLDETGSRLPRIVMVTPDVPDAVNRELAACGWDPYPVAPIVNPHRDCELLYPRFGLSFTKLRAFDLNEFDRLVFLDADTLVLRNIDSLFNRPCLAAAPDFFMPDRFNTGVMVLEPSRPLFMKMLTALAHAPSYDGGDQGFLNWFWSDWWEMPVAHRLRSGYNLHHFIFQFMLAHPSLRQHCLDQVHVVHYTLQKPWMGRFMMTGGSQTWWDKFYAAHPEQNVAWRRRLHQLQDWSFSSLVSLLGG